MVGKSGHPPGQTRPAGRRASNRVTLACRLSLVPGLFPPLFGARLRVPPQESRLRSSEGAPRLWGSRASQWERFSESEGRVWSSPQPTSPPPYGRGGVRAGGFMDRRPSRFPSSHLGGRGNRCWPPSVKQRRRVAPGSPPFRRTGSARVRAGVPPWPPRGLSPLPPGEAAEGKGDAH